MKVIPKIKWLDQMLSKIRPSMWQPNSQASLLSVALLRFFGITIFLFVVIMQLTVTTELVRGRMNDGEEVMKVLIQSTKQGVPNFKKWAQISEVGKKVKVRVTHNSRRFFTNDTQQFLHKRIIKIPFTQLQQIDDHGIYYYMTARDRSGTHYEIWLDFGETWHAVIVLLIVSSSLLVIILLIGAIELRRLIQRLNQPLLDISEQITENPQQLRVPASASDEVQALTNVINQALRQSQEQLAREKQFIADASHELRTPITAIKGNVDLIKKHGERNPEIIPEAMYYIIQQTERMKSMIEELLTLSRLENQALTIELTDLGMLIQSAVTERQKISHHTLQFTTSGTVEIKTNTLAWQHIVDELMLNAEKYSPDQSTITIQLMVDKTDIVLQVADQGVGIKASEREKVFQRLYRIDESRSQQVPGTGLGLSIVESYVQRLNGIVEISDNQPQGTIFTVRIPKPIEE